MSVVLYMAEFLQRRYDAEIIAQAERIDYWSVGGTAFEDCHGYSALH